MNLVLGTALDYNVSQIRIFVESFKKYHPNEQLALVVSPHNAIFIEYLVKNNVKLVHFETRVFIGTHINNSRFFKYTDFLFDHKLDYDKIFLTDTRDVVFQNNVFENTPEDFLYFFKEDDKATIGENPYNSKWITDVFGDEGLKELADKNIICCGTTLGTMDRILNYTNSMCQLLYNTGVNKPTVFQTNIDQGIHNYLAHIGFATHKYFSIKSNGDIVGTVGLSLEKSPEILVKRNKKLEVNGNIPAVIHQYDRSKDLIEFFNNEK